MMVDAGIAHAVLAGLVDRDSRLSFTLVFDEPSELVAGATGREVDDVLLDAQRRGLIVGERGEGDGSAAWWSVVRLTVSGLHALGQWPPTGREWAPGLWDDGFWGLRAQPLLARLRDSPPARDFYFREGIGDQDPEPSRKWTALLLLIEAGLVSGRVSPEGVDTLRITHEGDQALDPTPRDPLDVAEAELRSGAPIDAIVTAVELGLAPRLKAIADSKGVATTNANGHPLKLSLINNALPGAGAYLESDRAQVDAWLKLRNDVAHPDGAPSRQRRPSRRGYRWHPRLSRRALGARLRARFADGATGRHRRREIPGVGPGTRRGSLGEPQNDRMCGWPRPTARGAEPRRHDR